VTTVANTLEVIYSRSEASSLQSLWAKKNLIPASIYPSPFENKINLWQTHAMDRLCGLVARVSGYRSRGSGFDFRRFQIFWEAEGLERGPLSLVRTTEELLGRSSGSGLETRDYRPWESVALTTRHPLSAKVGTTSPASGGRSVGIVRSRTKATEFSFSLI
jgi:hypothetical protein